MNESCHTHEWDMLQKWIWHMCMDVCGATLSDMWHDSFRCVTWPIRMCDMTYSDVWHDSFRYVAWLIQMCDVTHSKDWQDPFRCLTWLVAKRDITRWNMQWDLLRGARITHCNTLQHAATCCTTLQHEGNTQYTATCAKTIDAPKQVPWQICKEANM